MVKFQWFPDRDDSPRFFFSNNEKKKISEAIAVLEKKTSAELRVHVEDKNPKLSILEQARNAFERLGMTQTLEKNGVLIFICSDSHEFAVLGDTEIDRRVPPHFWEDVSRRMSDKFAQSFFVQGVCEGIHLAGEKLQAYFPFRPDDRNELPDTVSHSV